jgi:hypothetical protein
MTRVPVPSIRLPAPAETLRYVDKLDEQRPTQT